MNTLEMKLRTLMRRSGLSLALVRLMNRKADKRREFLRAEFERLHPTHADVHFGGLSVRMLVENAEEYAHYLAEPEGSVMRAVFDNVRPGDIVWDVGANVGLYTIMLGNAVGPGGTVLGFEPMPACHDRLLRNIAANTVPHVRALAYALGKSEETLYIMQCSPDLEGDIRVVKEAPVGTPSVQVIPGDVLRERMGLAVPNVVKIDVQAFEEDVLIGLKKTLMDPACRVVICEIHYAIFAFKGDPNGPVRVERLLREYGFSRIDRIDRNHIACFRS